MAAQKVMPLILLYQLTTSEAGVGGILAEA